MTTSSPSTNHPDVLLIDASIMSVTLAVLLKELDPSLKIEIHEVLGSEAQESSNARNNAGAGHAALCELNYTPQKSDGGIDISKALQVNTELVVIQVIEHCFAEELKAARWSAKLKEVIPPYGQSLTENAVLGQRVRAETAAILKIDNRTEAPQ